ncbi:TetR/AcrR family transcriptional regulator [Pseudohalioglobus sediminis]|uniref:TetR/AcrR family transcriptional regulator n=1 Tax=Pseudohalioglobus sediminis TaxID=2606449 RepID=A0A5B0X419_9GAMM|nr:TetR/AcrR family transcriptional regulator [Pseudohalioglobus sediminis]KAA1193992.1 TetR/AcrR family transcriptional regulator [Pseudohalioglobus sediminis]
MATTKTKLDTREQILQAAENLFATQGYSATTIKQVAESVGIQGPAIYKHFANKRALFEDVLERLFSPFTDIIAQGEPGANQASIVRQHLRNPNASRIVQLSTLSGGEDLALLVERWYRQFFQHTQIALDDARHPITPVSVMAFHSMLLGYLTLAPLHQAIFGVDPLSEEALAELLDLEGTMAQNLIQ